MKIAVGNDHRGVDAKRRVLATLTALGHTTQDVGTGGTTGVDYPDFAIAVSEEVAAGRADRGVLICATGHGMCITANKVLGIRAVNCRDVVDAEMSRTHNDANVLCLSSALIGEDTMEQIVRKWLETPFENGSGRHARRNDKITQYEQAHQKS